MATIKKSRAVRDDGAGHKALSIVSQREGFRRGGRAFSKEATVIPLALLSQEEIALFKGEAMLIVTEVGIDASDDKAADDDKAAADDKAAG